MDTFDQYIYEELVSEYERSGLTDDDYEELYMRFCNLDHLEEVKPYLLAMRFFGLGTPADTDAVLSELKEIMGNSPMLNGLYYDLGLCIEPADTRLVSKLNEAVDAGYKNKYLRDKSNIKPIARASSPHNNNPHKTNNAIVESAPVDGETLTKDIVLSLLKNNAKPNSNGFRTLTLPNSYNKIGDSAFQGIKELDMLIIPSGYAEIASNAFSWAVIHQVVVPESVAVFGKNAFKGFTGVIECSVSSFAFKYAKRNNIRILVK